MDSMENSLEVVPIATALLLLLFCSQQALEALPQENADDEADTDFAFFEENELSSSFDVHVLASAALHSFQLCNCVQVLGEELGYWVKPRSTTWFSRFLLEQYDEERWVKLFRMTKSSVFALADVLKPAVTKKDTTYRLAIPVVVRVACALFKLTNGASLLICSEMFAVGRSSVSMLLRDVVNAINVVLRSEISWPQGQKLLEVESRFSSLCSLPGVVGAIDGTHVAIAKPSIGSADYFYFKSGGFSINCQAVVDSQKRFLDLFLGMPGSVHDSRVLRRSTLYHKAMTNTLWDSNVTFQGFTPYLLGDAGYPCMPWLMVPHHEQRAISVAERLFNRKQRRGRCVVENSFAILKQTFRELLHKTELHVTFVPDVITACAILHNMFLRQSSTDIERLFNVLRDEGLRNDVQVVPEPVADDPSNAAEHFPLLQGNDKRRELGIHLALRRGVPLT